MELIECWLTEEVHAMHGIVRKLWERAGADENLRIVSVLVSESSANILNTSAKIKAALRDIATHLA